METIYACLAPPTPSPSPTPTQNTMLDITLVMQSK